MSGSYSPEWPSSSETTISQSLDLHKACRKQEDANTIEESQYPTIESYSYSEEHEVSEQPQSKQRRYSSTYQIPDYGDEAVDPNSFQQEHEHDSFKEVNFEHLTTPSWDSNLPAPSPPLPNLAAKEPYQPWSLTFPHSHVPENRIVVTPGCVAFDSRHWSEFERPEEKTLRCWYCKQKLGYYKWQIDLKGPDFNGMWMLLKPVPEDELEETIERGYFAPQSMW